MITPSGSPPKLSWLLSSPRAPPPAPSLSRQLARQTRSLCRASRGPPGSVLPAPVPPGERAMEYQLYPTH